MNKLKTRLAGIAASTLLFASSASAATYDFLFDVGSTNVSGHIEVDETSANYVGGGTTDKFDVLDFSFTFTNGGSSFIGNLANSAGVQTMDLTYSADLTTIPIWDISVGFNDTNGDYTLGFSGNNFSSDYAQVADFGINDGVGAFTSPGPDLNATLSTVPLPAGLPLLLAGLGVFGLIRRRS